MFERFTKEARRVVTAGVDAAAGLGAPKVGPQHLLLSMSAGDGLGARVLAGFGVTAEALRAAGAYARRRAGLTEEEIAALRSVGVDAEEVFRRIEESFGPDALAETPPSPPRGWRGKLGSPFEPAAKKVLELSLREAIALRHPYIGSEHILLALLRAGVPGPMGAVLAHHGVAYDDAKAKIMTELTKAA